MTVRGKGFREEEAGDQKGSRSGADVPIGISQSGIWDVRDKRKDG